MSSSVAALLAVLAGLALAAPLVPLLRTSSPPVALAGAGLLAFGIILLALRVAGVATAAHGANAVFGRNDVIDVGTAVWTTGVGEAAVPTAGLFAAVALIAVLDRSRAR